MFPFQIYLVDVEIVLFKEIYILLASCMNANDTTLILMWLHELKDLNVDSSTY